MSIQNETLRILVTQKNHPISGQKLADDLNVSRNAIWKSVENLRNLGYKINSIPQKGYQLEQITKKLDPTLIQTKLDNYWRDLKVITKSSVTSTNNLVKQHLIDYPKQNVLIASKKQNKGRGRRGKSFYSELNDGLYFSLGFQPKTDDFESIPLYTVLTASALVETLGKYVENDLKIKWVNDIFYKGYKISGILSEVTSDLESGGINGVIIGVGINLSGHFDKAEDSVQEVAGTLFGTSTSDDFNQNLFLAEFFNLFMTYESKFKEKPYLTTYKNHLLGLNQEITYTYNNEQSTGLIKGIDENAHLIIEQVNGELKTLTGQEISFNSRQFIGKDEETL